MANVSQYTGQVHFEVLVQLLVYIRDNKNLGLKYYAKIYDATLDDLLRKDSFKTENQLMMFSYSIWQDCPDTGRSKVSYIVFYQGWPIDNCTHVTGPVAQYSADSEHNPE